MSRPKVNFILDVLMLLDLAAIAGIGVLMKFVLVPGSQRQELYGRNVELRLWGMDRHQWGSVHFALAIALAGLLVLHVVLHWATIVGIFRQMVRPRAARVIVAAALLAATAALIVLPLLLRPEVLDRGRGGGGRGGGLGRGPGHRAATR